MFVFQTLYMSSLHIFPFYIYLVALTNADYSMKVCSFLQKKEKKRVGGRKNSRTPHKLFVSGFASVFSSEMLRSRRLLGGRPRAGERPRRSRASAPRMGLKELLLIGWQHSNHRPILAWYLKRTNSRALRSADFVTTSVVQWKRWFLIPAICIRAL